MGKQNHRPPALGAQGVPGPWLGTSFPLLPTLQKRRLRPGEVKWPAPGHMASNRQPDGEARAQAHPVSSPASLPWFPKGPCLFKIRMTKGEKVKGSFPDEFPCLGAKAPVVARGILWTAEKKNGKVRTIFYIKLRNFKRRETSHFF